MAWLIVNLCQKYNTQTKTINNLEANCIKNKDQAIAILLGTGVDWELPPPTLTYKNEVEARGNQIFFDELSDGLSDVPYINYLTVGEELKNGTTLVDAQYSYHVNVCDTDLDKVFTDLSGDVKKYQFSFTNNDGVQDQFADETKICTSNDPKTQLADVDGDGQKEIIADCYSGGTSLNVDLYIYKLKDNKLNEIGNLSTRSSYELKDCNGDNILDIATHFRAVDAKDCEKEKCFEGNRMLTVLYCDHWDKQKNEFVETKIGEE